MNPLYITTKTAEALKKFFGKATPEPKDELWHRVRHGVSTGGGVFGSKVEYIGPAYQLHDLLSDEFCRALALELDRRTKSKEPWLHAPSYLNEILSSRYYWGGLSAVEAELIRMMEGK